MKNSSNYYEISKNEKEYIYIQRRKIKNEFFRYFKYYFSMLDFASYGFGIYILVYVI